MLNDTVYPPFDNKECKPLPGMEDTDEPSDIPQRLKMFNYLSGFRRAVGVVFLILVIVWIGQYRGGFGWYSGQKFNWHPMLMTLGMVFLYSNGMLIYRTQRSIGMQRLKVIHAGIMIFCALCTIIGLSVGFETHYQAASVAQQQKENYWETTSSEHIPDMYTLHSWVGLTSVILFFFQSVAGFFSDFYPGIRPDLQATYMHWHVYLGTGGFVGAVVACLLGFNEKAIFAVNQGGDYRSENTMIWFIYLTLVIFGGLSVYLVSQDRFKRSARPGDDDPITKEAVFGNLCAGDEAICCLPWTPNDCARSFQLIFSQPRSSALETGRTRLPPATTATPPSATNNFHDLKNVI